MGGALFTTENGEPIKDIPSGDLFLDFLPGTATDSAGTITKMNTNLDYYNLTGSFLRPYSASLDYIDTYYTLSTSYYSALSISHYSEL